MTVDQLLVELAVREEGGVGTRGQGQSGKVRSAKLPRTVTRTRQPAQRALQSSTERVRKAVQIWPKTFSRPTNTDIAEITQVHRRLRGRVHQIENILGHPCKPAAGSVSGLRGCFCKNDHCTAASFSVAPRSPRDGTGSSPAAADNMSSLARRVSPPYAHMSS